MHIQACMCVSLFAYMCKCMFMYSCRVVMPACMYMYLIGVPLLLSVCRPLCTILYCNARVRVHGICFHATCLWCCFTITYHVERLFETEILLGTYDGPNEGL